MSNNLIAVLSAERKSPWAVC